MLRHLRDDPGAHRPRPRDSQPGVDWEAVAHLAVRQGVMPLVYRSVASALGEALPPSAAILRREMYGNSLRSRHLAGELVRIAGLLEAGGVAPIALKGPALAAAAYGDVTLRQFSDLDLLVRQSEATRAVEILAADGYAPQAGYDAADIRRRGTFELSLMRSGSLAVVDLHWRLVPPYFPVALDGEDLWRRAVRVGLEGGSVRGLAPEDQMLFLCAHGAKHGWQTLGGICDLAELMRSAPLDWDALRTRAGRIGARRMLMLGALLAHELLDAGVPADVVAQARGEPAVARAARTFHRYVASPGDGGPALWQRWSIPARMIAAPGARIRYLAARALLPSADDRGVLRLPRVLRPLYYLLRPARIALTQGAAAVRRLTRPNPSPADHWSR